MIQFAAGDDGAFDRIVENFQRQVYATVFRYIADAAQADDLAQEVFLRLYKMRRSYKPTARLSTLVYRITVNLCLNFIRDTARRRMASLDEPIDEKRSLKAAIEDAGAQEPVERLEAAERAGIVRRALDLIPPRQKTALLLHRFEGLSYADIAEVMETNVAAVKSLLSRARASLADALQADIDAGNL
jgi:RNA polymerase sigma-70 factor (ECF subfamily)